MEQQEQSWSTGQSQHGKALSYWKDVICGNLLSMQIASDHESEFFGHMAKHPFGPLKANFISVSEQRIRHARPSTRGSQDELFHLIHVRKGVQFVEQHGRSCKVESGNCLLVDCLAAFDFQFPEGVEALVLEIRRDWLRGWLPAPEDATVRLIDGKSGWGATLVSTLGNLTPSTINSLAPYQTAIAEQIALMFALAGARDAPCVSTHKRALLRRLSETLRERCQEHGIDPDSVARTLGVSRRYVHVLFASAGTTFTHELYECRLQRARRLLRDKRFDGHGVAEIAWNCGFTEPSHFTRRFRERFGAPPTVYRQQAEPEHGG
jgi:AraC-like DNA-binding protein